MNERFRSSSLCRPHSVTLLYKSVAILIELHHQARGSCSSQLCDCCCFCCCHATENKTSHPSTDRPPLTPLPPSLPHIRNHSDIRFGTDACPSCPSIVRYLCSLSASIPSHRAQQLCDETKAVYLLQLSSFQKHTVVSHPVSQSQSQPESARGLETKRGHHPSRPKPGKNNAIDPPNQIYRTGFAGGWVACTGSGVADMTKPPSLPNHHQNKSSSHSRSRRAEPQAKDVVSISICTSPP